MYSVVVQPMFSQKHLIERLPELVAGLYQVKNEIRFSTMHTPDNAPTRSHVVRASSTDLADLYIENFADHSGRWVSVVVEDERKGPRSCLARELGSTR